MDLSPFMPHGQCMLWDQKLIMFHAVMDGMIALAYFSIPVSLVVFLNKRKDINFKLVFWLFASFILSCGVTHVLSIYTMWRPDYWIEGWFKALCAGISVFTALFLWNTIPKALSIPSGRQLEEINQRLIGEVAEKEELRRQLQVLNQELEHRVEERTRELDHASREVQRLKQGVLRVCAWSKQIEDEGKWISFEEFMNRHFHLRVTHAMSDEAMESFMRRMDLEKRRTGRINPPSGA